MKTFANQFITLWQGFKSLPFFNVRNYEIKHLILLGVKNAIDKANGYCFGVTAEERNIQSMLGSAFGATDFEYNKTQEVREKYMETEEGERITNHLGQVWSFFHRIMTLF